MEKKKRSLLSDNNFGTQGWILIIYGLLALTFTLMARNTYMNQASGIYEGLYGWNKNTLIGYSTYGGWAAAVIMMFIGQLMQRFSPRKICGILGIISAGLIFCFGLCTEQWHYAVVMITCCITTMVWTIQVTGQLISNWFPRKKGMAMGWMTIGFPLGGLIGVPLFNALNASIGMKNTYFIYGGLTLILAIVGLIVIRDWPEDKGAFPDNDKDMTKEKTLALFEEGKKIAANSCWTVKRMFSIKETWFIGIGVGAMGFMAAAFMSTMIPRLLSLGYDIGTSVTLMTVAGVAGCVGSVICGFIDQKVGPRKAIIITLFICVAACILNLIPSTVAVVISMACIGMVNGGSANYLVSIVSSYWGRYHFVRAFKVLSPFNQIIASAGALVVTSVATVHGNYTLAYIIVGIIAVIAAVLMFFTSDKAVEAATEKYSAQDGKKAEPTA